MKKMLVLSFFIVTAWVWAQSPANPQPVDFRYSIFWDDPNPPGSVSNWVVTASGATTRLTHTVTQLSIDYPTLLVGQAAGVYAISIAPVSITGLLGEGSTNHFITWPGGSGKLRGPVNLRSTK